jgi:thiol-disulfide isomerase/thioredoxin
MNPIMEMAMHARSLFLGLIGLAVMTASGARAFEVQPYTRAAAQSAIQSGKPVVLEIYASWCPVCMMQASSIDAIKDKPNYKNVSFFRVDYDAQKDVVEQLKAPRSTLIVYRGGKEVGRESWGPSQEDIAKVMMKAAQ